MAKELKLYLPLILQDIAEYEALSKAETPILEDLEARTNRVIDDSFLSTMSEERLREWEKALSIHPSTDPISQRRSVVLSKFRGTGKLSGTLIKAMVNAFTGGQAEVSFEGGVLTVGVTPPSSTFEGFSIEAVNDALSKRVPAHIMLNVELRYLTWGQISNLFTSWEDIANGFTDWNEVNNYYTSQRRA